MLFLSQSLIGDNEIRIKALTSSHHTPSQLGRQASWAFLEIFIQRSSIRKLVIMKSSLLQTLGAFLCLIFSLGIILSQGNHTLLLRKARFLIIIFLMNLNSRERQVSIFQCPCLNHLCGGLAPKHRQNNQATKNQTKGAKLQLNQRGIREIIMQKAF